SFFIADILNISIGNTFSGGLIDFTLFGVLQGNAKTNWILVLAVGAIWAALYYFTFRFLITKFNVMTPGREPEGEEVKVVTKDSMNETAVQVLEALGGKDNLDDVDACITRLRVAVKDVSKVDKVKIKALGAPVNLNKNPYKKVPIAPSPAIALPADTNHPWNVGHIKK
ncbi:glucose PTS transporter subunit EIIB, partial [Clostridium perfringens]|uniref:glucose PTS transporter subunit EIIB n=1 Tax=Clostridium perfringens TaxID=1502 RepID=UPI002ACEB178